jgi:hypothetical protein
MEGCSHWLLVEIVTQKIFEDLLKNEVSDEEDWLNFLPWALNTDIYKDVCVLLPEPGRTKRTRSCKRGSQTSSIENRLSGLSNLFHLLCV